MLNAIRLVRTQPATLFSSPLPYNICRSASGIRFWQAAAGANQPQKDGDMEQQHRTNTRNTKPQKDDDKEQRQTHNRDKKTGDVMSDSFGEGYATRSDEEGFGGIYGGNDSTFKAEHPAYDKSQGSEVAEKEKGRHQKTAEC